MNGSELRLLRNRMGLTQAAMARELDVAPNTLARWERGEFPVPERMVPQLIEFAVSAPSGTVITRPDGVARDPHHRAIIDALEGHLDPDVFEACAADLLHKAGWPVVPVAGGGDDGFDGAVADGISEPSPLVSTTGKNLTANLRRNLNRAREEGWTADRALFATSRQITGPMRKKLRDVARQAGFTLVHTFDRDWFANRLYENPSWCKRLLNVSGGTRALSVFPRTGRPVIGDAVLGREDDVQWLRSREGDCLLTGAPGSGKTFLLRSLAIQGDALFLVGEDPEQVANDLRELKPDRVIIDDAHIRPDVVERFVQLRQEVGYDGAQIVATCWPGEAASVRNALGLSSGQVRELALLDADTIIEVIRSVGVQGPNDLLALIRKQAGGRPGLAATLAHLCQMGDIRQVVDGEALVDYLVTGLDRMLGKRSKELLAPFALAGDAGATIESIAEYLGVSKHEVASDLALLGAAGVVRQTSARAVSIHPEPLRWALVRDVFFGSPVSLNYRPLLDVVSSRGHALRTLIGARSRGAPIPELVMHLEDASSADLWADYASLGETETQYVMEKHPKLIGSIADPAMLHRPEAALPTLLEIAQGEGYEFSLRSTSTLGEVEEWAVHINPAMDEDEVIRRRTVLLHSAERWWERSKDDRTTVHAMCLALSPGWEGRSFDPGTGMKMTLTEGVHSVRVLERLAELWPAVASVARQGESVPWSDVLELVASWWYGHPPWLTLPEETHTFMRNVGERMLRDLAAATDGRPGVQHLIRNQAGRFGLDLDLPADPDFESAYPGPDVYRPEDLDKLAGDLARRLQGGSAEELGDWLARLDSEARIAGMRSHSSVAAKACGYLADGVSNPLTFASTLVERELPGDFIQPFLWKAASDGVSGWIPVVERCLAGGPYVALAVSTVIRHPEPPAGPLVGAIGKAAETLPTLEQLCLLGLVPDETLQKLFLADDDRVAATTALGHWRSTRGDDTGRPSGEAWRSAIVRSSLDQIGHSQVMAYLLGEVLSGDGSLAADWLVRELGRRKSWLRTEDVTEKAVRATSREQRLTVLRALPSDLTLPPRDIVRLLVDDDLDLYRELLDSKELDLYHLAPLAGNPDVPWATKALLALDAGYSEEAVVNATWSERGLVVTWSPGSESDSWAGKRQAFEALRDAGVDDLRVSRLARRGEAVMRQREEEAKAQEQDLAVHVPW